MNKKFKSLMKLMVIVTLTAISFVGCGKKEEENINEGKITVFTSILPQKYFVEKIGGNRVKVQVLVSPGKNPATYEPTPGQVIDLSNAKILFTVGVPFENTFLEKVRANLKNTKIVDTSSGIKKRYLEKHSHDSNYDDHETNHHTNIEDPHIWMSPILVKIQAKNIYNALIKEDPQGKEDYLKGYENIITELDELDMYLKNKLAPYKGNKIFVYHPSFGYFTDEYGLHQEAVETGGKEPVPAILEKIIQDAKKDNVKIVFVQPEFSQKSANAIAKAINGKVVTLNPLNPDYINNIKKIADEIQGVLKNE